MDARRYKKKVLHQAAVTSRNETRKWANCTHRQAGKRHPWQFTLMINMDNLFILSKNV
jgi:hypothetical protein